MEQDFDIYFMAMALREAEKAAADGEVPTGCVVVEPAWNEAANGYEPTFDPDPRTARILGRAHNQTEMLADATAHAEMLALSVRCARARSCLRASAPWCGALTTRSAAAPPRSTSSGIPESTTIRP